MEKRHKYVLHLYMYLYTLYAKLKAVFSLIIKVDFDGIKYNSEMVALHHGQSF